MRGIQFTPTRELSQILLTLTKFTIEETKTETEERAENIAFTANKQYNKYNNNNNQYKKNFKESNVRPGVCHYCYKPGYHWIKESEAETPNWM